jgi:hypothetical protein
MVVALIIEVEVAVHRPALSDKVKFIFPLT